MPTELRPEPELDFSWWLPVFSAVVPVAVMTAAVHAGRPGWSLPWGALLGGIAVLPFVLDVLDMAVPFRVALPVWLFVPTVIAPIALLLVHPADLDLVPFIFVILCAEMATRLSKPYGAAVALACVGVMVGLEVAGIFHGSFIWVVGILFGWGGGFAVKQMMLLTGRLQEAQAGLAEKAAAQERSRIAREIHDVIAHSMSVTMLHVTAARMGLERGRSDDALDALQEAERQGRTSLNDIRRTVGLLGPDESAAAPPAPGVSDLPKLVTDFRSAGLDVALDVKGDITVLPSATGLSLYRIVQESLTNIARHAPGASAHVVLNIADVISLTVTNGSANGSTPTTPSDGGGLGIKGMVERASLLDGQLHAGPAGDGWAVELVAPLPST